MVPILGASLEGRGVVGLVVGGRRGEGRCRDFFRRGVGRRLMVGVVVGSLLRRGVVGMGSPGVGGCSRGSRTFWDCPGGRRGGRKKRDEVSDSEREGGLGVYKKWEDKWSMG